MSELHVVALSGGKDSTAMALELKDREPREYTYICTPTGDESDEMFAHWRNLKDLLGGTFIPIVGGTLTGLIAEYNALPNWRQRWCTRRLKIEPYARWLTERTKEYDTVVSYVGLRADELEREGGDYSRVPGVVSRFPLREWGFGIEEVLESVSRHGITIPSDTDCELCFFNRLSEWHNLWKNNPEKWELGESLEEKTGYTFRSPKRDTWPASMKGLREQFESGKVPRGVKDESLSNLQCRVCKL